MSANINLNKAKDTKNDEFYTRREDIENELGMHSDYKPFFENKVVYMNCDDPVTSEFWQFFVRNFGPWKLKKLVATHYEPDEKNYSYKIELSEDTNGDGKIDWNDIPIKVQIPCNGDFRSAYCIDLLKEADIVVTNPPFSLWREYILQLVEYNKKFVIIGSENNISYQEIFPLFQQNKVFIGYTHPKIFKVPNSTVGKSVYVDNDIKYQKFGNICWFTNLDIQKVHNKLDLRGNYYDPSVNLPFDNYEGINVKKVDEIPGDYDGIMGVPITYLGKHCPDQFDILGIVSSVKIKGSLNKGKDYSKYIGYTQDGKPNGRTGSTFGRNAVIVMDDGVRPYYEKDGIRVQNVYPRIFIRKRKE